MIQYRYENTKCEVCLSNYYDQVIINAKYYSLYEMELDPLKFQDYMLIE